MDNTVFEQSKKINEYGAEYWTARDLYKILEYAEYRNILPVLEKAKEAAKNSGAVVHNHFVDIHEMVTDTNQASEDLRRAIGECLGIFPEEFDEYLPNNIGKKNIDVVEHLIRTEKLKLLDEVIHQSTVNLKSAMAVAGWAELRKKQLEAEL